MSNEQKMMMWRVESGAETTRKGERELIYSWKGRKKVEDSLSAGDK
jgi:hypothetical protein